MNIHEEYREGKDINEQAMLANIRITSWGGGITDKQVSAEVAKRAGAQGRAQDVGYYNKRLLRRTAMKDINRAGSDMRAVHYRYTMPWDDMGARLLPIGLHERYVREMDELIERRIAAKAELVSDYSEHLDEARARLGSLFDAQDFPSAEQLRDRITQEYHFSAVPTARHFAVESMNKDVQSSIRKDIEERIAAKIQGSVVHLYERLYEVTGAVVERLGAEGESDNRIFRNSLLSNMQEVIALVPALNLTGSSHLDEMAAKLGEAIDGIEPNQLRPNHKAFEAEKREQVKAAATDVQEQLAGYFG